MEIGVGTCAGKVDNPHLWFDYDGAQTRFMQDERSNLIAAFRDSWIGSRGVAWTPPFPERARLDFSCGV